MLKVVGASWLKKRISTYILVGAGLLAVGALFIAEMDRPQFDGTYCATIYWSKQSGFQVEYWKQRNDLNNIPKGVARTCYKDSIRANGWSQLEIETQRHYPDWVQAFAAGILEGSLTWRNIYYQWSNTISFGCDRDDYSQNFCTWLRDNLVANYEKTKEIAESRAKHDHYWHQVRLFFYQLEGLQVGFKKGVKRSRTDLEIPPEDFLLMNAGADLEDLKAYFDKFVMHENSNNRFATRQEAGSFVPRSSMLLTLSETNESGWKFLFGHSSAGSYSSMLRMHKRYKFSYHISPDMKTHTVSGSDIIFTSYPGVLASTDDFYIVKGRHMHSLVAGIAIQNNNSELWRDMQFREATPLAARVMAANRLAHSHRLWAHVMKRNPAIGNKQWIVVDLKKIDSTFSEHSNTQESNSLVIPERGFIWIVEQYPNRLHAEDITNELLESKSRLWFSKGQPYNEELLDISNISDDIFSSKSIKHNLTNLDSVDKYLRNHAFRGDLLGERSIPYGNIDMKLFSFDTETGHIDFHAIAGPIASHLYKEKYHEPVKVAENREIDDLVPESLVLEPKETIDFEIVSDRRSVRDDIRALANQRIYGPFKWSHAENSIGDIRHDGHPDVWDFGKVTPRWAWLEK